MKFSLLLCDTAKCSKMTLGRWVTICDCVWSLQQRCICQWCTNLNNRNSHTVNTYKSWKKYLWVTKCLLFSLFQRKGNNSGNHKTTSVEPRLGENWILGPRTHPHPSTRLPPPPLSAPPLPSQLPPPPTQPPPPSQPPPPPSHSPPPLPQQQTQTPVLSHAGT